MTKTEIIQETIAFYSEDTSRRSVTDQGLCVYNAPNDRHCAVGRCMLAEYREQGTDLKVEADITSSNLAKELRKSTLDEVLEAKYRGHDGCFWSELQVFHDTVLCWDADGLTPLGISHAEKLLKVYSY